MFLYFFHWFVFLHIFVGDMMLFQNPIVWLMRFRKRKGYGVHSPFAFNFVTEVLYNHDAYYAYGEMDKGLRWWQRARVRSMRHLAFRLSNFQKAETMYCRGVDKALLEACQYGSKGMRMLSLKDSTTADLVLVGGADMDALRYVGEGTMVVVKDIHKCRAYWKRIKEDRRVTVTFDLYDVGIAFARKDLNRQHYKVNW